MHLKSKALVALAVLSAGAYAIEGAVPPYATTDPIIHRALASPKGATSAKKNLVTIAPPAPNSTPPAAGGLLSSAPAGSGTGLNLPLNGEGEEGDSKNLREIWERQMSSEQWERLEKAWANARDESTSGTGLDFTNSWTQIGAGITNVADTSYNRTGRATFAVYSTDTNQSGSPNVLWVSGTGGGIFKAVFLGLFAVMVPVGDKLPASSSVGGFAIWPFNSNFMIAGTGDASRVGGSGIYRTDDAGASWYKATVDVGNPTAVYRVRLDSTNPNNVVIATNVGIYRSTNFGLTYTRVYSGHVTDVIQDTNTYNSTTGYIWYAGVRGTGVIRSLNWGATWATSNTGMGGNIGRVTLAYCQNSGAFVYAAVEDTTGGGSGLNGIYRSSDYGGSWTNIKPAGDPISYGQAFHTGAIAVNPNNASDVVVGMGGAIRSTNATAGSPTWANFDGGHADYRYMTWRPGTSELMVCNDGGYYLVNMSSLAINGAINTLGLNLTQVMQPISATAVSRSDPNRLMAGLQDNGVVKISIGGTPVIKNQGGGDGGAMSISPDNVNNIAFTSGYGFGRYTSTDSADSVWNNVLGTGWFTDWGPGRTAWAHQINLDQSPGFASRIYAVQDTRAYYQSLPGTTTGWTNILSANAAFPVVLKQIESVSSTAVFQWYVSQWGGGRAYRITGAPGSGSYTDITPPGMTSSVDSIVTADKSTAEPTTVYYVTGMDTTPSKAFVSYNGGTNWTDVTGDAATIAPGANYWQLAVLPNNHNVMFLATSIGVLRSDNGGTTWYKFMKGMPTTADCQNMVLSYDFITGAPKLRVGTYGRGWFERVIENVPTVPINIGFYNAESIRLSYNGVVDFQATDPEQASYTFNPVGFGNNVWISLNVPTGTYRIWFKPDRYLAQAGTLAVTSSGQFWYPGPSKGGDADGDNEVSILDYLILSSSYDRELGQVGYDARADFDGDNIVSILDYLILSNNYGLAGADR